MGCLNRKKLLLIMIFTEIVTKFKNVDKSMSNVKERTVLIIVNNTQQSVKIDKKTSKRDSLPIVGWDFNSQLFHQ